MIRVCGRGAVAGVDPERFSGSIVFMADERQLGGLCRGLTERIQAAIGEDRAIVWVAAGSPPRLTVIAHDGEGRVLRPTALPTGRTIPAGAAVERGTEGVVIQDEDGGGLRLALEDADAGALSYSVAAPLEAWIRYFHYAKAPSDDAAAEPELAGFRFRVFEPDSPAARASVRFDPARPFDRTRSRATPEAGAGARRTNFRTPWGGVITLTAKPPHSNFVYAFDPVLGEAYPTLDGFWDWAVVETTDETPIELLPGYSGAEYARAPASWMARFVAGAPAFADRFRPDVSSTGGVYDDATDATSTGASDDFPLVSSVPGVPEPVTTAWVYIAPAPDDHASASGTDASPEHAGYYSQPGRAALFTPEDDGSFLEVLALEAAPLPPDATTPHAPHASFPAAPYAGIDSPTKGPAGTAPTPGVSEGPGSADTAGAANASGAARVTGEWLDRLRRFETEVLGAARTEVIYGLEPAVGGRGEPAEPRTARAHAARGPRAAVPGAERPAAPGRPAAPLGPAGPTGPVQTAVTPQGLLSRFSADHVRWEALILAQTHDGDRRLSYTDVRGKLREALLANQLFLVVSDVEALYRHCSTTYCVTDDVIARAEKAEAPPKVLEGAAKLVGQVYPTRDDFLKELKTVLGDYYEEWKDFFVAWAEYARLTIAGWTFDLASRQWDDGDDSTILILKFGDGDVESLVRDRSRWTLPEAFNDGGGAAVQERLIRIIEDARRRVATEPELEYFVDTVLANRQESGRDVWNGVLYLNAAVPTDAFPPEIAALAAGLPPGPLRAHHLGVTLTSFDVADGRVRLADTSLFGLILYDDPEDLVYEGSPYDYKVLSLRVRFANSTIASFSSRVELLVARLFDEFATLEDSERGNNIVFDGTLQDGAYRFATSERSRFAMTSEVLDAVTIEGARFVTDVDESTTDETIGRFILHGSMAFHRLDDFDLFGFGPDEGDGADDDAGLVFSNLLVSMRFDPDDPTATRTFDFVAGRMTFDLSSSRARPGSLPRRFPLEVVALRQGDRPPDDVDVDGVAMPSDLGFIPVESPLGTGSLGDVWFGLELALDFGGPGALAPKLGFSGALLAAWAPSENGYDVAIGLRLPGSEDGKKSLTIMGPLKLAIRRLNFLYDDDTRGYLLRLQDIALSFLGLSFPPGGRTNALLFGDPDPAASNNALGWYAAYKKDEEKEDEATTAGLPVDSTAGRTEGG